MRSLSLVWVFISLCGVAASFESELEAANKTGATAPERTPAPMTEPTPAPTFAPLPEPAPAPGLPLIEWNDSWAGSLILAFVVFLMGLGRCCNADQRLIAPSPIALIAMGLRSTRTTFSAVESLRAHTRELSRRTKKFHDKLFWLATGCCLAAALVLHPSCLDVSYLHPADTILSPCMMAACFAHSTMAAHIAWRCSSRSDSVRSSPCLSHSFWRAMLRESAIFVATIQHYFILNFKIFEESGACEGGWVNIAWLACAQLVWMLAIWAECGSAVNLRRLCRPRRESGQHFVTGLCAGIMFLLVPYLPSAFFVQDMVCAALMAGGAVLARNATIVGFFCPVFVMATRAVWVNYALQMWVRIVGSVTALSLSFMLAAATAAETSRDSRLLLSFILIDLGTKWLSVKLLIAWAVKLHARMGRDIRHHLGSIGFLKFRALKRRREADPDFAVSRHQDTNADMFGDPAIAKYILVVSHPWLSVEHADPRGVHLGMLLQRIEEKIVDNHAHCSWTRWWWRYYYLHSEGDILIFFDMCSIPQPPRTSAEDVEFKQALGLMNFLYYSFNVVVIRDPPGDGRVPFLNRGWCWAEASIAKLGEQLHQFSPEVLEDIEKQSHEYATMSFADSLHGVPHESMQHGTEQDLAAFRRRQEVQGKIFTNGKQDAPRVAQILTKVEGLLRFRSYLRRGDAEAVANFFLDSAFLVQSGLTPEVLSNTVFDGSFATPLHIAVDAGSEEIVRLLFAQGAQPYRDYLGHWPWEGWCSLPKVSAAAIAASKPPAVARVSIPEDDIEMATFPSAAPEDMSGTGSSQMRMDPSRSVGSESVVARQSYCTACSQIDMAPSWSISPETAVAHERFVSARSSFLV